MKNKLKLQEKVVKDQPKVSPQNLDKRFQVFAHIIVDKILEQQRQGMYRCTSE